MRASRRSLSRGKCVGETVACPFHGWQFDPSGNCTKIPSIAEDAPIPKRAKIDSYPTEEIYDWVWVFLGDLPEDKRPAPPRLLPEFEQTETWRTTRMVIEAPANWQKFEENSLDTAHLAFVHATFGSRLDPKAVSVPIVRTPYGARLKREKTAPKASQKSGVLGELLKEEREKTTVELEFSVLGVCHRINPTFRPGLSQVTFSATTPIDAKTSRQFGLQARNYAIEPEHDQERLTGRWNAINEDIGVISFVRPALGPTAFRDEVLVRADEMESTFRHLVFRMIDAGWEIDHEKVQREWDRKVYVIPSPARRLDPTGWAHEACPTTKPRTDDGWDALLRDANTSSGVAAE
ncbi:MAG: Rieske 2Fe-2S domain-containing protein [Terricaulis sp.]|nr:Rieske 2Fe-2S domain-containing protein [Terricaulis sp.]